MRELDEALSTPPLLPAPGSLSGTLTEQLHSARQVRNVSAVARKRVVIGVTSERLNHLHAKKGAGAR